MAFQPHLFSNWTHASKHSFSVSLQNIPECDGSKALDANKSFSFHLQQHNLVYWECTTAAVFTGKTSTVSMDGVKKGVFLCCMVLYALSISICFFFFSHLLKKPSNKLRPKQKEYRCSYTKDVISWSASPSWTLECYWRGQTFLSTTSPVSPPRFASAHVVACLSSQPDPLPSAAACTTGWVLLLTQQQGQGTDTHPFTTFSAV